MESDLVCRRFYFAIFSIYLCVVIASIYIRLTFRYKVHREAPRDSFTKTKKRNDGRIPLGRTNGSFIYTSNCNLERTEFNENISL